MKVVQQVLLFVVITSSFVPSVAAAAAQERAVINGTVVDELGGAIVNARITVRDAAGATVLTTTSDRAGAFAIAGLSPGRYDVQAESDLFEVVSLSVQIAPDGPPQELRFALKVAGLTDSLVVTGRRMESKLSETPQKIELVTSEDIERSVAVDLTDLLKKNSGVDVIQFPGLLSGIGMRGFAPEFGGINKRSLLLIDGRPSGVTNLASLLLENVDHVEVLKGPASSIYGASAMAGVVNVITKRSRGPIAGSLRLGARSFGTSDIRGRVGGSITPRVDFDASVNVFDQRDDYRVGSGSDKRRGYSLAHNAVLPYTSYRNNDAWLRVGADVARTWRLDGRVNVYQARDVSNPGDVFFEGNRLSRKDFERSTTDIRLQGQLGSHMVSTTAYTAGETAHSTTVTSPNPADRPFLPFLFSETYLDWKGLQVQDAWGWRPGHNLVIGLDSELVESQGRSYLGTGARTGPISADNTKRTVGVYAENTARLKNGSTVISLGGRVDNIRFETFDTPFKTGFRPSATAFTVFNPSVGVKQLLMPGVRAHGTAGRAFVPADARALTGFQTNIVGGRTQIRQGNPNLRPERSVSFDVGVERTSQSSRLDVTYFQTKVTDRVVANVVISNPAPPDPVIVSFVNALGARMRGMDVDFDQRLNRRVAVSASATHYFTHKEQLPTTGERDINVIAENSIRAGIDLDVGPLAGRVSTRYVQGRRDLDFNTAGNPQIDYEDFATVDLSAIYHLTRQHALSIAVNNLFDTYYYEKLGYPHPGRTIAVTYRFDFGRRP